MPAPCLGGWAEPGEGMDQLVGWVLVLGRCCGFLCLWLLLLRCWLFHFLVLEGGSRVVVCGFVKGIVFFGRYAVFLQETCILLLGRVFAKGIVAVDSFPRLRHWLVCF